MKRKLFLAIGMIMALVAVGFVVYALGHPEASFPWGNTVTYTLYLVYLLGMVGCFVASRRSL